MSNGAPAPAPPKNGKAKFWANWKTTSLALAGLAIFAAGKLGLAIPTDQAAGLAVVLFGIGLLFAKDYNVG